MFRRIARIGTRANANSSSRMGNTDEIARSRRLLQTAEDAEMRGHGVIDFEGAIIGEPLLKCGKRVIEIASGRSNA